MENKEKILFPPTSETLYYIEKHVALHVSPLFFLLPRSSETDLIFIHIITLALLAKIWVFSLIVVLIFYLFSNKS